MPASKYDSYGGSSSGSSNDDEQYELIFTPEASIEADIDRVFGADSDYGQSLGVVWENIELTDGLLYLDAEKEKYKLFSWGAVGFSASEAIDRGIELAAEDADEVVTRTYFGDQKTYELVAAVVEPVDDIPASSRFRRVESIEDGVPTFTDWQDNGGEPVGFDFNFITWYSGNSDFGPSTASQGVAETLTEYGEDIVTDEDDVDNWLADTSGNNILRDDLSNRRVEHFLVRRESENGFNYNVPVFRDAETGMDIVPDNRNETTSDSALVTDASSTDSVPEPVADFINTADGLQLDEERAGELLDDMIADDDTALTGSMIEEAGGRNEIIGEVV